MDVDRALPMRIVLSGFVLVLSAGCSLSAWVPVLALPDAGAMPLPTDAGPFDAGPRDAGAVDAGPVDAGLPGTPDAGALPAACNGSVKSPVHTGSTPPTPPAVTLPSGFTITTVAAITNARQLAALPNGDLVVGTSGMSVYLIPAADSSGPPGAPVVFGTINDAPVQGVAYAAETCTIYAASNGGVYEAPYHDAQQSAVFSQIAAVRTGPIAPNSDGDVHKTTSVGVAGGIVYAGVGSSCNACTEVDPTRAVVLSMLPDGGAFATKATRFRNAIALATNPATDTLWAGGAGQDDLAEYHPYEFIDPVTLHPGIADYGWYECEEDQIAYTQGADCSGTVAPRVELPAYSTIIGATFYPLNPSGPYAFPASYRGGLFLTAHGSWHQVNGMYVSQPQVAFVPMTGDTPSLGAVNWNDPTTQWTTFVGGFQLSNGVTRIGRPTGVAVGPLGSLFVADDQNGFVYRIRPQ